MTLKKITRDEAMMRLVEPSPAASATHAELVEHVRSEISKAVLDPTSLDLDEHLGVSGALAIADEVRQEMKVAVVESAAPRRKRQRPEPAPAVEAVEPEVVPVSRPAPTRKRSTSKKRSLEKLIKEAGEHIDSKDWTGAAPSILVGVYARGHYVVYGNVLPTELEKEQEFLGACSAAGKVARKLGSVEKAYQMVKWSWERERDRLTRPQARTFRMGWRFQFSDSMVNDYLAAMSIKRRAKR